MLETAFVFDTIGHIIHWHEPLGRSSGHLPDSRELWDVLWKERYRLGGVAHSHPWKGEASPSHTDVTTFKAIELGLGKRLLWPIVTFSEVRYFVINPLNQECAEFSQDYLLQSFVVYNRQWSDNLLMLRDKSRGDQDGREHGEADDNVQGPTG